MTRPIANPANVTARSRRRQRPSSLLRSALVVALVATCLIALPTLVDGARSLKLPGDRQPSGGSGAAAGQVAMSGLHSGACMSFAPAGGHSSRTVFIDPGHGGLDPGVVGDTGGQPVLEKDVALAVGTRLSRLLQDDGYRVVMSRTADSSVTMLSASDSVTGALTDSAEH